MNFKPTLKKIMPSTILATLLTSTLAITFDKCLAEAKQTNDWNILFITSDEHNPKITGYEGNPTIKTPALDQLARQGSYFSKAYCATPVCAPTRQSIITGLYGTQHGQHGNSDRFSDTNKTWAHFFESKGYYTGIVGKTHHNNPNYHLGYSYWMEDSLLKKKQSDGGNFDPQEKALFKSSPDKRLNAKVLNGLNAGHDGAVLEESIKFLTENKNKKFFLHASFFAPHWPWNTPKEFYYMYDPNKIDMPILVDNDLEDDPLAKNKYQKFNWNQITPEQQRLFRARYYSSVSWVDYNIGELLKKLDQLGLSKKTLVIYTSDHGDMAGEKGLWLKNLMFDSSARVPCIIRMPGVVPANRKNKALINHVDLFPTIAGLVKANSGLPKMAGKNYAAVVKGTAVGASYTFSTDQNNANGATILMVRSKRWKYILENKNQVLYDMEQDPNEINNLAQKMEYKSILKEHQKALDDFLVSLKNPKDPNSL